MVQGVRVRSVVHARGSDDISTLLLVQNDPATVALNRKSFGDADVYTHTEFWRTQ